jgi:peptidoglycan/LPS O-acetylase OafA/YrhL
MGIILKQRFKTLKEKLFADITDVPAVLQPSHLPGLDGLRGISILIVIFGHFAMYRGLFEYVNGEIGVEIFFVISGFLITSLLLKEKVRLGTVSFKNFYVRRILRIVPVAYLFLIVLVILNVCFSLNISTKSFITSFFYLKNIPFKGSLDWYSGHFWSLSVEEQFYICFPFFIVFQTNKFIFFSFLLIVILPLLNILGFHNVGIFYSSHIIHIITFIVITLLGKGTASILIGSLYSIFLFKKIIIVEKIKSNYFISFGLLIFACYILTRVSYLYIEFISVTVFALIVGYIILLNLKEKNLLRYFLDSALLSKIGVLSYSLYIWQQIFTGDQSWGIFKYSNTIIVRFTLLFIVSYFSYYYFEKFFLRYKDNFKSV